MVFMVLCPPVLCFQCGCTQTSVSLTVYLSSVTLRSRWFLDQLKYELNTWLWSLTNQNGDRVTGVHKGKRQKGRKGDGWPWIKDEWATDAEGTCKIRRRSRNSQRTYGDNEKGEGDKSLICQGQGKHMLRREPQLVSSRWMKMRSSTETD